MKPFREIHARDLASRSLKDDMDSEGYLLIRELLPANDLSRILRAITQIVLEAGWLLPDHGLLERMVNAGAACGDPDPSFMDVYEQIFSLEAFHALAHHPALQQVMTLLTGPHLLIHPKPIGRLIFPNCERLIVHAHQDHTAIAGDPESFTAWMPLHDCPEELGHCRFWKHRIDLAFRKPLPVRDIFQKKWRMEAIGLAVKSTRVTYS
ncbi:MAG TPA: hypothetical protein VKH40_16650, partial [Alloacidobacterium sp.]|nr:hypothetical protein [Alloacidobacterium sp.]